MSLLIKGMDMPESCEKCKLCEKIVIAGLDYLCCKELNQAGFFYKRRNNCPLVEIPRPHGSLIEKPTEISYEGLRKIAPNDFKGIAEYFLNQIKELPTIIEAEGENDKL